MQQIHYPGSHSRSRFVTLTSWLCIVVAACLCSLGLVPEELDAQSAPSWLAGPLPGVVGSRVLGGMLLLAVCALTGAVGLLLRQEWARRVFIGLLGLVMLACVAGLWLQHLVLQSLLQSMAQAAPRQPLPAELTGLATVAQVMAGLVTLLICAGLGWMIKRLRSPVVRQEFAN
ncbi:hypothetical protein LRH25_24630 [Ideonella azotifigens]|uniref:Uncharacterized protein n=1 Tax=Ideonella azotifigens TaxID=513160 RepID=A0ABN1JIV9_9BURK|nr:hypothetical protein [Ideonella azotifigens]MCD2343517.1 hypothetical protein [Ideonella azotifigens]